MKRGWGRTRHAGGGNRTRGGMGHGVWSRGTSWSNPKLISPLSSNRRCCEQCSPGTVRAIANLGFEAAGLA